MTDNALQKELDTIRDDLSSLRTDVGRLTEVLGQLASAKAGSAGSDLEQELSQAKEALGERLAGAKTRADETLSGVMDRVSERPMASLLTAFGIGFIVAKLFGLGDRR